MRTTQKAMRERKEALDTGEQPASSNPEERGKSQSMAIAAYLDADGGHEGAQPQGGRSFRVQSAEDVRKVVQSEQNRNRGIIDPRTSAFIQNWDLAMLLLLLFTALITPYEVVFLPASNSISVLFVVNRLVDAAFGIDMYIQFHLGFQAGPRQGNKVVMDRSAIRCRYLSFWFWIDALSVMPLWIIGFVVPSEPEEDELSPTVGRNSRRRALTPNLPLPSPSRSPPLTLTLTRWAQARCQAMPPC